MIFGVPNIPDYIVKLLVGIIYIPLGYLYINRIKNSNKPKNKINLINFEKDNNNPDKLGKNIKNEIEIDYSNVKEKMNNSILSKSIQYSSFKEASI